MIGRILAVAQERLLVETARAGSTLVVPELGPVTTT